jgi:hypothetical protein
MVVTTSGRSSYDRPVTIQVDAEELKQRLDRIEKLTEELAKCEREAAEQRALAGRIRLEILAAREALKPVL